MFLTRKWLCLIQLKFILSFFLKFQHFLGLFPKKIAFKPSKIKVNCFDKSRADHITIGFALCCDQLGFPGAHTVRLLVVEQLSTSQTHFTCHTNWLQIVFWWVLLFLWLAHKSCKRCHANFRLNHCRKYA